MSVDRNLLRTQNLSMASISLVLIACTAVLLYFTYTSQMRIQNFALDQLRQDADKRARAVSYFYMERRNDLKSLAEQRVLSNFFENQALGMSMKYGLRDSLLEIAEKFDSFLDEKRLDGRRIYTRVLFVNRDGSILTERAVPEADLMDEDRLPELLPADGGNAELMHMTNEGDKRVAVVIPYYFKQVCVGRIIACIAVDTAYDYLLRSDPGPSRRTSTVTDGTGRVLYAFSGYGQQSIGGIQGSLGGMVPGEISTYRLQTEKGAEGEVAAVRVSIQDTPFFFVSLAPVEEVLSGPKPARLVFLMAVVCLVIIGGMLLIIRINSRKFVLQARLDESAKARGALEEKNELLKREIVERLNAEESMRNSEERFSTFMSHLPAAVFIKDQDGRILFANQYLREIFDWQDCIGSTTRELQPGELAKRLVADDRPVLAHGLQVGTVTLRNVAGVERIFEIYKFPVRTSGDVTLLGAVAMDVTERKKAEEELEKYKQIVASTPDGISLLDRDYRFSIVNKAFEEAFGGIREDFIGQSLGEHLGEEVFQTYVKEHFDWCLSGETVQYQAWVRHPAGGKRFLDITFFPYVDTRGQIAGVVADTRDITERRLAEEALQKAKEFSEALLASMQDGLSILDSNGRHLDVNLALCEMTGFSREELIGSGPPAPYWPPEAREEMETVFQKTLRGESGSFECTFVRKNGERFPVIVSPSLVTDKRGNVMSFFATIKDIGERKRLEGERLVLERRLMKAEKAESLGRMAGAIAHHFNNQLSVVMGNIELAMEDLPQDEPVREDLCDAMLAARRSSEISRLMLTYLGQSMGKRESLDLSEVCRQYLPMLQDSISQGIVFEVDLLPGGPVVGANTVEIHQVLAGLITNARESIGDGGGKITLATKIIPASEIHDPYLVPVDWQPTSDDYACIQVTDTGCGMTESNLDKIFDPFFTTKFTGRGLGLAAILGNVKLWGGVIGVESQRDQGSTFRIFLPLVSDVLPRPAGKGAEVRGMEPGGKVLLVEDQDKVRNTVAAMLVRMGFDVLAAPGGAEAVELLRANPGQVLCVITDLSMPGMDGWQTLAALRKMEPHIPAIMVSGYEEVQAMAGDYSEQPRVFLHKPYSKGDLREAIDTAVKARAVT